MVKKTKKPEQQSKMTTENAPKTQSINQATEPELQEAPEESEVRIFVAICRCGVNIAGVIDVDALREYALTLPHVVASEFYLAYCTDPGAALIREQMEMFHANRLVIGACTPKTHEPVFKAVLHSIGIDDSYLEFCNLREHSSFVHMQDKAAALATAKDLVRAAVARAAILELIPRKTVPVTPEALVIGGGIGGLQAALDVANHGFKVHVVEKEPTIGGKMAMLDRTFPTDDCSI